MEKTTPTRVVGVTIEQRLADFIRSISVSPAQLAEAFGVSRSVGYQWVNGDKPMPPKARAKAEILLRAAQIMDHTNWVILLFGPLDGIKAPWRHGRNRSKPRPEWDAFCLRLVKEAEAEGKEVPHIQYAKWERTSITRAPAKYGRLVPQPKVDPNRLLAAIMRSGYTCDSGLTAEMLTKALESEGIPFVAAGGQ